ncbi:MAG: hypothetical protein AB7N71_04545 [Phycisphaerae bacterium]
MNKILQLCGMVGAVTLLMLVGFGGFLVATGKVSADKLDKIGKILRDENIVEAQEVSDDAQQVPTSQPTEDETDENLIEVPTTEQVDQQRMRDHLTGLRLARAKQDVAARQDLLRQAQQALIQQQEEFEANKSRWLTQREKIEADARDDGFERELSYVANLSPKLAKEHIVRTWQKQPLDALRLFNALKLAKGKKILEQFKTDEEVNVMHQLLERLRLQGTSESSAAESGMSSDAEDA